jgi:hypothetical protein
MCGRVDVYGFTFGQGYYFKKYVGPAKVTHRAACLQHTVHADCLAGCVRRPPPYLFCSAPRTVLCALPPVDWDVIVVRAPVPLAQGWLVYSRAKFPEFGFQQRMESSRASPPHTGRERMGSPTLQALQDPILLLLPWAAFDWRLSKPSSEPAPHRLYPSVHR